MVPNSLSNADLLEVLCGPAGRLLAARPLSEVFGIKAARRGAVSCQEERAVYASHPQIAAARELYIRAVEEDMGEALDCLSSPAAVRSILCGRIGGLEHEAFWCLWMNGQNQLLCAEEMFRGTLTQVSVFPREVVRRALDRNAAAVVIAHNHPSGSLEPSRGDEMLTTTLKNALALIDVRVLDHFIVAGNQTLSFAERGLL